MTSMKPATTLAFSDRKGHDSKNSFRIITRRAPTPMSMTKVIKYAEVTTTGTAAALAVMMAASSM